jgi:hypothetical protein
VEWGGRFFLLEPSSAWAVVVEHRKRRLFICVCWLPLGLWLCGSDVINFHLETVIITSWMLMFNFASSRLRRVSV